MAKIKERIIAGLLIVLSLAVAFALLEGAMRLFTKPIYPILQSDREVGTIMKQNVRGYIWHREPQKEVLVITNSLGFGGFDVSPSPSTSTVRAAFLGDSFTAAIEVDYFRTFVYLLQESLNVARKPDEKTAELLNFGVGGSGTFLQYQYYKKHIAQLRPQHVFLVFSGNDFTDNLNKIDYDPEHYAAGAGRNIGLRQVLLQSQLLKFVFSQLQGNITFLSVLDALGLYELNDNTKTLLTEGYEALKSDPNYYAFTFDLILRLDDAVKEGGGMLHVIMQPEPVNRFKTIEEWRAGNADYAALEAFLKSERIPLIVPGVMPLPTLRDERVEEMCYYWDCVGHMNEDGHRLAARLLYPHLRAILYGSPQ